MKNHAFFMARLPGRDVVIAFPSQEGDWVVNDHLNKGPVHFSPESIEKVEVLPSPLPAPTSPSAYKKAFRSFQTSFLRDDIEKAILSAVIIVDLFPGFDPVGYFKQLSVQYPGAFTYLLHHPSEGLWCGASPEILIQGSKNKYRTTALAGTQRKNSRNEYSWGNKEVEEHAYVVDFIEKVLTVVGAGHISKSKRYTSVAGDVAHLKTDFGFTFGEEIQKIVKELHPTPAVAGTPRDRALDLIRRFEEHRRSLYTGYLGKTGSETEIYVNLRCMQIGEGKAAIYTGGGLTRDSDPDSEWQETRLKAKTLLNLLKTAH